MNARWLLLICAMLPAAIQAGSFLGAESNVERITHPPGTLQAGVRTTTVCLAPSVPPAAEIPVRNAVDAVNRFQPRLGNMVPANLEGVPNGRADFETVFLHELGHCLGLGHSALGPSELANRPLAEREALMYTTISTAGANGMFQLSGNADGVRGSRDDQRGDDANLHWYRRNVNNPFAIDNGVIDRSTYSRALSFLPGAHNYAELASAFRCPVPNNGNANTSQLRGQAPTQSVMFPVICLSDVARDLAPSDVATMKLAQSGLSGDAGNLSDNYTLKLNYIGYAASCDVRVQFDSSAGFALCSTSGSVVGNNLLITSGTVRFQNDVNWWYNPEDRTDKIFANGFE